MISAREGILLFNMKTYNVEKIINAKLYYGYFYYRPFTIIDNNNIIISHGDNKIVNIYNTVNKTK